MADAERQLAVEGAQRPRVAALAVLAGILFFGGQLWTTVIVSKEASIGVLQGLAPAFSGLRRRLTRSAHDQEQFLVHHQFALIAGFVISGIGADRDDRCRCATSPAPSASARRSRPR